MVEREYPDFELGDKETLVAWLEFHRATLEMKCDGLTDEQLRTRSTPPSSLSLMGLLRHMAQVERGWFRNIFEGDDIAPLFDDSEDPDVDLNDVGTTTHREALAMWRAECDHARALLDRTDLGELSAGRTRRSGSQVSMRWIVTHMIEEYARHNGHADLIREAIDGATGA